MGRKKQRISTDGGASDSLSDNPFAALSASGLPQQEIKAETKAQIAKPKTKGDRGRLDVRREKAGRGGKTVTVISGFKGIASDEKASLAKTIQKSCGVGGAVKDGAIEIQGDKREEAKSALEKAGFRVVFSGG